MKLQALWLGDEVENVSLKWIPIIHPKIVIVEHNCVTSSLSLVDVQKAFNSMEHRQTDRQTDRQANRQKYRPAVQTER